MIYGNMYNKQKNVDKKHKQEEKMNNSSSISAAVAR